jgi:hypothetical protein
MSSGEDEEVSNTHTPFSTISLVMMTASSHQTASVLYVSTLISDIINFFLFLRVFVLAICN